MIAGTGLGSGTGQGHWAGAAIYDHLFVSNCAILVQTETTIKCKGHDKCWARVMTQILLTMTRKALKSKLFWTDKRIDGWIARSTEGQTK